MSSTNVSFFIKKYIPSNTINLMEYASHSSNNSKLSSSNGIKRKQFNQGIFQNKFTPSIGSFEDNCNKFKKSLSPSDEDNKQKTTRASAQIIDMDDSSQRIMTLPVAPVSQKRVKNLSMASTRGMSIYPSFCTAQSNKPLSTSFCDKTMKLPYTHPPCTSSCYSFYADFLLCEESKRQVQMKSDIAKHNLPHHKTQSLADSFSNIMNMRSTNNPIPQTLRKKISNMSLNSAASDSTKSHIIKLTKPAVKPPKSRRMKNSLVKIMRQPITIDINISKSPKIGTDFLKTQSSPSSSSNFVTTTNNKISGWSFASTNITGKKNANKSTRGLCSISLQKNGILNNTKNTTKESLKTTRQLVEDNLMTVTTNRSNVSDFALCTTNTSIKEIKNSLSGFCQRNDITLTESDELKYLCTKANENVISLELSKIGATNIVKLHYLSGQESITREMIKNIIITIGF